MDSERFDYLINGYFDGELSSAERQELDSLVISDAAARDAYWRFAHAHACLRAWGEQFAGHWQIEAALRQTARLKADHKPRRVAHWMGIRSRWLIAVSASLVLSLACTLAVWHASRATRNNQNNVALPSAKPDGRIAAGGGSADMSGQPKSPPDAVARPVARLVLTYACDWSEPAEGIADGDGLKAGQRVDLRSGLAELEFACGARVILQGPASLVLDSGRAASLSGGKVTVRAETVAAKGFAVLTPSMKAVDLGTEFGLEVASTGVEQVHVFRGEVVVSPSWANGPTLAPQHLTESQGIEVNASTQGVKLVANNGQRFARSLDDAKKSRHVVAYWRFEDHAVGVLVPESKEGVSPVRGSLDSSINCNDLYTWNQRTQPRFSGDVPAAAVPQTGDPNSASLDNTIAPDGAATRDLFTMSAWSHPSGADLQTITPARWTIEASIRLASLPNRYQTFLVRDGINASAACPWLPPLAFQVTPERHVKVLFCDVQRRQYQAIAENVTVEAQHWYHVAATSDGKNLRLYIDSLDGNGYCLWAVTGLATDGATAMGRGYFDTDDPLVAAPGRGHPYIWSVGRGYSDGRVNEWFRGWIDEVRICDTNLDPAEFLFAQRAGHGRLMAGQPQRGDRSDFCGDHCVAPATEWVGKNGPGHPLGAFADAQRAEANVKRSEG